MVELALQTTHSLGSSLASKICSQMPMERSYQNLPYNSRIPDLECSQSPQCLHTGTQLLGSALGYLSYILGGFMATTPKTSISLSQAKVAGSYASCWYYQRSSILATTNNSRFSLLEISKHLAGQLARRILHRDRAGAESKENQAIWSTGQASLGSHA